MAHMLGHVYFYCKQNGLPPLTVLVVNQDSGLPGEGVEWIEPDRCREQVFAFNWYGIWPPTPDEFKAAYDHESSHEAAL